MSEYRIFRWDDDGYLHDFGSWHGSTEIHAIEASGVWKVARRVTVVPMKDAKSFSAVGWVEITP